MGGETLVVGRQTLKGPAIDSQGYNYVQSALNTLHAMWRFQLKEKFSNGGGCLNKHRIDKFGNNREKSYVTEDRSSQGKRLKHCAKLMQVN
jgi:hypothetical protein